MCSFQKGEDIYHGPHPGGSSRSCLSPPRLDTMYQPHKVLCGKGTGAFGCLPEEAHLPQLPTPRRLLNSSVLTFPAPY